MPETDYICCAMLLLCKTALQQDCTAAFTPMPFTQRRVESAPAHSKHAWDRTQVLCHAAAVQNSLTAGLHCCFYTLIAFHSEARRVGISPQQPCLRQIISAVPCCCCAKPPFSRTAPLHLHLCLSLKGASSQHQPTASMPGTEHKCSVMLLLCKTASQLDCTAAFTP